MVGGRRPDDGILAGRSRGFISGVLQGSWGLGFALSSLAYGFFYAPL